MIFHIKTCFAIIFGLITMVYLISTPIAQADEPPMQCPSVAPATAMPADSSDPWSRAHEFATGAGVRVAVIDTGISPHPYLPQIQPVADLVDGEENGALNDCDGHGTVVAGVLAGRGPLGGVAPDVELLSIRQTSNFAPDASAAGTLDSLAEAIELAIDRGAQVINVSVVSCVPGRGQRMKTVLDDSLARAESSNVVVVAAAGNLTDDCHEDSAVLPAHFPTVLAVSASTDTHTIASYSIPNLAEQPALSAAGRVKIAADPRSEGFASGMLGAHGNLLPFEGTSFAAPVVTGTAALLKQRFPNASAADIRARIAGSAAQGTGYVDPYAALTWMPAGYKHISAARIGTTTLSIDHTLSVRATQLGVFLLLAAAWCMITQHRRNSDSDAKPKNQNSRNRY